MTAVWKEITVAGIAKGAGMIAPHMATLLSFVLTDAVIAAPALRRALKDGVDQSFNRITVDGDTSTNDTLLALANGKAGNAPLREKTAGFKQFSALLNGVLPSLAKMIARDGEGATKLVEVVVENARNHEDAQRAARAIAESPLVKTAFFGADANWGRILCAGYSGAIFDPSKADIFFDHVDVARRGQGTGVAKEEQATLVMNDAARDPRVCGGRDTPKSAYAADLSYAPKEDIEGHADTQVCVAFGHRRLSIIDLSPRGHQPLCIHGGRYWIVFNGEIYNHIELRGELEREGCRFASDSDTEVVLAAYAHWGRDCLHRFNGMWAFAIFDVARNEVFLARDRFGIKPLYYWNSPDGLFSFGSEIKQFRALPNWEAWVNPQAAYDFLTFGISDHSGQTHFRGVMQVPPGCAMVVKVRRV